MSCVTPADLGKPIAAIVERCGTPNDVVSIAGQNEMFYIDGKQAATIFFDADQMRVRIVDFYTLSLGAAQTNREWSLMLPFAGGAREVTLGRLTLADAAASFAADADVTTRNGVAFHSSPQSDIVLNFDAQRLLQTVRVGERMALAQNGSLSHPIDQAPLDLMSPVPRDAWLQPSAQQGPQTTVFRVDVDAAGIVRKIAVIIPSSNAEFDASMKARVEDARFQPATLSKRPIAGTCFVQVRH